MPRPQLQHGLLVLLDEVSYLLLMFIHERRDVALALLGQVGDDVVHLGTPLFLSLQRTAHVY